MTQRKAFLGSTALLIGLSGTASADVTPSDVWANFNTLYDAVGYEIEAGSVVETASSVTVSDLTINFPNPYGDLQDEVSIDVGATLPSMTLQAVGDGTVDVIIPDTYIMTIVIAPDDDDTGTVEIEVDQTGLAMNASGEPDTVTYSVSAPSVTATFLSVDVPGEDIPADAFNFSLAMNELAALYTVSLSPKPAIVLDLASSGIVLDIDAQDPDGNDGMFTMDAAFSDVTWTSESDLVGADFSALTSLLQSGGSSVTNLTHGGARYRIDFEDGFESFNLNVSAASGAASVEMGDASMRYLIGNTGMALTASGSEIPLPQVAINADATAFGMSGPVIATPEAKDMSLSLRFEGLEVSDMIWGMIDPVAQLPRDPANLILELAGKGNWFLNIMDPEAMMSFGGDLPGSLEAVDITEMEVTAAGASLTGSGGFTFDMNDMTTFDGLPAPTGAMDMQLTGANGLLDTLVGMGLVPQDQAMGARMMLGLFARPGNGPDALVSRIEVDGASGSVSANGQRLR